MAELARLPEVDTDHQPRLSVAPRRIRSDRANIADGWVVFVPVAGAAVGTAIREFGVFGVAGSVGAGLLVAVVSRRSGRVVARARGRSAQFAARPRLALPAGSDG